MTQAVAELREIRSDGSGDIPTEISKDDMFDILSSSRRRYAVHYLKQQNDSVYLRDLSERVAAWESGVSIEGLPSKHRKRVYTSFQQFHLPKMERLHLIDFDPQTKLITLTSEAQQLDVYLDVIQGSDFSWHLYYLGLSAVIGALGVSLWLGLFPFTLFPAAGWILVVAVVIAVSALTHANHSRQTQLGKPGAPPGVDER